MTPGWRPSEVVRSWSLRWKLTAAFGIVMLAVVLFQVTYFPRMSHAQRLEDLTNKALSLSELVAHDIAAAYDFGDAKSVQEVFRGAESDRDIRYLALIGKDGVFAAMNRQELPPVKGFQHPSAPQQALQPGLILVRIPVKTTDETKATLIAGFSTARIDEARRSSRLAAIPIAAGIFLSGLLISFFIAHTIGIRVQRLAGIATQVASGDLRFASELAASARHESGSRGGDELESLADAFRSMCLTLEGKVSEIVTGIGVSEQQLTEVIEAVRSRTAAVTETMAQQNLMIEQASSALDALNRGTDKIGGNVNSLLLSADSTTTSINEMASSLQQVSRETDVLSESVERTAADANQMVGAIEAVDRSIDTLRQIVTDTSASMLQMNQSIAAVENAAARSYDVSTAVKEAAEKGKRAVVHTRTGMERIHSSVSTSNVLVSALGARSEDIGKILAVINDVARKTHLLSLNAAILAVQAGKEGRGFSVVAEEIGELAGRTAGSTRDIGSIIAGIQKEIKTVLASMEEAVETVASGVTLAAEADSALAHILDASSQSSDMAKEIAHTTREQASGSIAVAKAITAVQQMVQDINVASREQTERSSQILETVGRMHDIARHVRNATEEQKTGSAHIAQESEKVMLKVREIADVAGEQAQESRRAYDQVEQIRLTLRQNQHATEEMASAVRQLSDALRSLHQTIAGFRVSASQQ